MKKIASLLAIIFLIALMFPGCTRVGSSMNGSGKLIDNPLELKGFTGLNVRGPFVVEVVQAADYKVTLSVDENLVDRVIVSMERKTLNLSIAAPATFFPTSLRLKVEMPDLVSLTLSDAAIAAVSGFKEGKTFSAFLFGKSNLNCSMEGESLELNVSGESVAKFRGNGQNTVIDARGVSKLDLLEFQSTGAKIKMTESSEATMDLFGIVDISLDKYSKLFYTGTPIFRETAISGGSTMAPK